MTSKRLISYLSTIVKHNLITKPVNNSCVRIKQFTNVLNVCDNLTFPQNLQIRHVSAYDTKKVEDVKDFATKFEVTKDPEDWKYVERVLAPLVVPTPQIKSEYSSGWKPPSDKIPNEKYFVPRNKNYMVPVYLCISYRGQRRITKIRNIQGDVFELEKDLNLHLKKVLGKDVATQVNELVAYIHIKGDHVNLVKKYLTDKGF